MSAGSQHVDFCLACSKGVVNVSAPRLTMLR